MFEALRQEVNERGLKTVRFQPAKNLRRVCRPSMSTSFPCVPPLRGWSSQARSMALQPRADRSCFIGNKHGEIGSILARYACGLTVDEGDSDGLARAVHQLAADPQRCKELGANARRAFQVISIRPMPSPDGET